MKVINKPDGSETNLVSRLSDPRHRFVGFHRVLDPCQIHGPALGNKQTKLQCHALFVPSLRRFPVPLCMISGKLTKIHGNFKKILSGLSGLADTQEPIHESEDEQSNTVEPECKDTITNQMAYSLGRCFVDTHRDDKNRSS